MFKVNNKDTRTTPVAKMFRKAISQNLDPQHIQVHKEREEEKNCFPINFTKEKNLAPLS